MNQTIQWKKTQPGSTTADQSSDGMLVTAEDLSAAMRYPLSVVQVLLEAYFGCGIVCGLNLNNPAGRQGTEMANGQPGPAGAAPYAPNPPDAPNRAPTECDPNFILTVEKGVALGCDWATRSRFAVRSSFDLTPDRCRPDPKEKKTMFVAARRVTAAEAAARPCGCSSTGGEPAQQCTRMLDHVLRPGLRGGSPAEGHLPHPAGRQRQCRRHGASAGARATADRGCRCLRLPEAVRGIGALLQASAESAGPCPLLPGRQHWPRGVDPSLAAGVGECSFGGDPPRRPGRRA